MIFIPAKLDILSIRSRDALLEIQSKVDGGLIPAQIVLWYLEHSALEQELNLYDISPAILTKNYPLIIKFQKLRYFFKNYLLLYRYLGECKKALFDFQNIDNEEWLRSYQILAQNELELYCGDIIDRQNFVRNSYNIRINCSYLAPIVDFLELYDSIEQKVNNSF